MADEISLSWNFRIAKDSLDQTRRGSGRYDVTTAGYVAGTPSISHSAHEALPMGDVATAGFARFKNLDSTNFVRVGVDSGGTFIPFLKLMPGEESPPVRLATSAPYAKADTAAVVLEYELWSA